ncbi:MAG: GntR family transcriptional regulator [Steroidobacteraceae bacterium]
MADKTAQYNPRMPNGRLDMPAKSDKKIASKASPPQQLGDIDVAALQANERSLRELAYERLLDMLLVGELRAGAPLQERRLAEALNISRTPVREALHQLETEGLVTRQMGRLMTVLNVSLQDYIEILNIRKLLEVEAAGLAAGRIGKPALEEMRRQVWALMEAEDPSPAQHWHVDDLVHYTIAEAADNKLLLTMIRDLRRRTRIFNTRRIPGRRRPGSLEHLALIDAVAAGDSDKARALMAEHLENAKTAIVQQVVSAGRRPDALLTTRDGAAA